MQRIEEKKTRRQTCVCVQAVLNQAYFDGMKGLAGFHQESESDCI